MSTSRVDDTAGRAHAHPLLTPPDPASQRAKSPATRIFRRSLIDSVISPVPVRFVSLSPRSPTRVA